MEQSIAKSRKISTGDLKVETKQDKPTKKVTHLHLDEKGLQKIKPISNVKDLLVIYLHNNEISKIENLDLAIHLTRLYLQRNKILKIENLECLKRLQKLYIGFNKISVVEGLENLESLEELHVEKQDLPEGVSLCFDPRTMLTIGKTLQVLNISHNKIVSISSLEPLRYLKVLNAAHNEIDDTEDVCNTLRNLFYLTDATFIGNPIAKKHRYRENIIANSYCLGTLDKKNITEETRCFIKRFEREKMVRSSKQSINLADIDPNLPKNYPPPIQKAVSASIIRDARKKLSEDEYETFDERNAVHIAWNALPKKSAKTTPALLKMQKKRNAGKPMIVNSFIYTYTRP